MSDIETHDIDGPSDWLLVIPNAPLVLGYEVTAMGDELVTLQVEDDRVGRQGIVLSEAQAMDLCQHLLNFLKPEGRAAFRAAWLQRNTDNG